MDLQAIRELLAQFDNSSLTELKIEQANTAIYFSKNTTAPQKVNLTHGDEQPTPQSAVDLVPIIAPIVGTVYLQASPTQSVFKQVGDHVAVGETVALIEAMKMMTEIKSQVAGVITEIGVMPEQIVEYGHVLFTVQPD